MVGLPELPRLENDGLPIAEVGYWSEQKYRLVSFYASLFIRSIRRKWDSLVCLDLFAGPGYVRFKGTNRIVAASPLAVLGLPEKFDSYIFCESKTQYADALAQRCSRDFSEADTTIIPKNANESTEEIIEAMPQPGRNFKVLGFYFLDPCKMSNLQFSTIELLSKRYMDFLVLIPSGMDTNRNEHIYTDPDSQIMDDFVGNSAWRERWQQEKAAAKSFENFIVEEFGRSMKSLNYIDPGIESAAIVRSTEKNLLLYRLALFSKNPLGKKFWNETQKYTNPQTGFGF